MDIRIVLTFKRELAFIFLGLKNWRLRNRKRPIAPGGSTAVETNREPVTALKRAPPHLQTQVKNTNCWSDWLHCEIVWYIKIVGLLSLDQMLLYLKAQFRFFSWAVSTCSLNVVCGNEGALEEVIESLKVKIREQEEQLTNKQEPPKCLICMVGTSRHS